MARKKTPPASVMAETEISGTDALKQLVDAVANDATLGDDGDRVTAAAAIALEEIAAGNADAAVWWSIVAMDAYRQLERDALMRGVVGQYRKTAPAVKRSIAILNGKAKQATETQAKAKSAVADALRLIRDSDLGKTVAQKKAAKQHKISPTTVRKFWPKNPG